MNNNQPEHVCCNLCGSDTPKLLFASTQFPDRELGIVRCRTCGLVYRNIRQNENRLRGNYAQWDEANFSLERITGRNEIFAKYAKLLAPFRRSNRILDVGAGHGLFLSACAKRGWDCYGVEISQKAVEYAQRNFGLSLSCCAFEESRYPDGFFDVVVFFNVLEFLSNPKEALRKALQMLRPGGVIIVRFSNAVFHVAAYRFFIFGGRIHKKLNCIDHAVIHLYAFDRNSITRLLRETGFTGVKVSATPLSWGVTGGARSRIWRKLACKLLYVFACFLHFVSFKHFSISPSLVAFARKD